MRRPTALLLASLAATACGGRAEPLRPSFVLVYTDDQRYDCAGATGNTLIDTPELDRLARAGMVFDRAYCTTSRCCPARASVLTGKYANATGIWDNGSEVDLNATQTTFPERLQRLGYHTAFFGKWHLPNPGAAPRPGFDRWVGYEGPGHYVDQPLNVDGERVATKGFQTDVLTDYAVRFVEEQGAERPFFLMLALKNCHTPLQPPPRHRGRLADVDVPLPATIDQPLAELPAQYQRKRVSADDRHSIEDRATFRDEVRAYWELALGVDESVGRLREALERSGAADHTLFLFTTDNGQLLGEHGFQQKGLSYEPSIRVPLIVAGAGLVAQGTRRDELVLNVDLAPTLLELAGAPIPDDVQGESFAPLLADAAPHPWRQRFLYQAPTFSLGQVEERALVERRWKYVRFDAPVFEEMLFDLENDSDERVNLAREPEAEAQLARLRVGLQEELARLAGER